MKIGFIGSGNMASAFISGFLSSGIIKNEDVFVSDASVEKLNIWKKKGVNCETSNTEVVVNSDIIFFAVKPNVLPDVLTEIKRYKKDKLFVSMAAGFSLDKIEKVLGKDTKIIRIMPNIPVLVRCGMTVMAFNSQVLDNEKEEAKKLLMTVGEVIELEEKFINAATALHGSSPAYIYMMIDAMANSGVKYGLDKKTATLLAAKAVEGSAKMVLNSSENAMQLRDDVCSPGGTTIEAVLELERNGFCGCVSKAIDKCVEKAENM